MFPILQSPQDVALIFSFTLPGNFCMIIAAVSSQQPGMGNCTDRADNIEENTKQEDLLIQEYCIPAKMSKLQSSRPLQDTWQQSHSREEKEDIKMV